MQTLLTCVFHLKSLVLVTPRYLMLSTFSRSVPSKVYEAWIFLIRFLVSCIILHLTAKIYHRELKSHTPLPCPGTQSINITLKFHCVFFILNFTIANSHQQKVLFQTQYLMRCHLCTKRTTRDQERCPGEHPTKPEPSQILLHLQQLVVVWSKEKNLSISMFCHRFHS